MFRSGHLSGKKLIGRGVQYRSQHRHLAIIQRPLACLNVANFGRGQLKPVILEPSGEFRLGHFGRDQSSGFRNFKSK